MPKRGENIHKRKDGRWEARYKKGIDANGKTVYGSIYANTYREVKAKLQFKQQGKTIIIISHNSEDIGMLCDTVHEMDKGILTRIS